MQSDDVIWSVINTQFCSYKVKTTTQNFCRNEYNVTGFCNRQSCPLANSRYATVREHEGVLYLYVKTIERAHSPKHMWEKITLSNNYSKALEQIDAELIHWPNFTIHKCKQRVTKITQYLIKMRRLRLRQEPKLIGIKKKLDRREAVRERKALSAAHIERAIEKELLERLKSKAYGDAPLNVNEHVWQAILDREKRQHDAAAKEGAEAEWEDELEMEDEESEEDEEEGEEDEGWGDREFVSDVSESDEEDVEDWSGEEGGGSEDEEESDSEQDSEEGGKKKPSALGKRKAPAPKAAPKRPPKKSKRGPRVEVEYEREEETMPLTREVLANW